MKLVYRMSKWFNFKKDKPSGLPCFEFGDGGSRVKERSNVIQYDCMGYPLRLIINNKGKQEWLNTDEQEGDVVLQWYKVN